MLFKQGLFATLVALFVVSAPLSAQAEEPAASETKSPRRQSHLSLGGELSSFSNDFGMGLRLTSPFLAGNIFAFRLHGGIHWKEGYLPSTGDSTWELYGDVRLGTLSIVGNLGDYGRIYGEGGGVVLIPSDALSDELAFGGYGMFGFEFYGGRQWPVSYFIEAGGTGTSGRASELAGEPKFANGFTIQVGLHWYPY